MANIDINVCPSSLYSVAMRTDSALQGVMQVPFRCEDAEICLWYARPIGLFLPGILVEVATSIIGGSLLYQRRSTRTCRLVSTVR